MKKMTLNSETNWKFKHTLSDHPLFQYVELKKLALRHPFIRFNSSKLSRSQNLDNVIIDCPSENSLEVALNEIKYSNACIVIREVQKDQQYSGLINDIFKNIQTRTGLKDSQMKHKNAWIFITSPGGVTPYHRDQETIHFFHIHGAKKFFAWDHEDREIVSQEENEYFHGANNLSKTIYKDQFMFKAKAFDLKPRDGLCLPATAPHMVENETTDFSVSFSLTYMSDEDYRVRRIYKINQIMRKLGLSPRDVYQSKVVDFLKLSAHFLARTTLSHFSENWKNL
jgi:hypothetical protein